MTIFGLRGSSCTWIDLSGASLVRFLSLAYDALPGLTVRGLLGLVRPRYLGQGRGGGRGRGGLEQVGEVGGGARREWRVKVHVDRRPGTVERRRVLAELHSKYKVMKRRVSPT